MSDEPIEEVQRTEKMREDVVRKHSQVGVDLAGFVVSSLVWWCLGLVVLGLFIWASSAMFENSVRRRLVAAIENATGGRAEIGSFHWQLLHLQAEARNITVHGLETAGEAPYAHVDVLRVQVSILDLFSLGSPTRIVLRDAEIDRPEFHLIVYADGTTNQPHPTRPRALKKPLMETLFDARVGKLVIDSGAIHIADQVVPLDLRADDAKLQLSWVASPAVSGLTRAQVQASGSYQIALSLGSLAFADGKSHPLASRLDASLLLLQDGVRLDFLRLAALDRTLSVSGRLDGFAHPEWQARAEGQVDLRVLAPYANFPNTRSGVLNLRAVISGRGFAICFERGSCLQRRFIIKISWWMRRRRHFQPDFMRTESSCW